MIYILGAGAMARETFSIYADLGKLNMIGGFIEENRKSKSKIRDKHVLDASIIKTLSKNSTFIGGIGSPLRRRWIESLEECSLQFDSAVHPSVIARESVNIGKGCIICPGAVLTCDIDIGNHNIINCNSTVHHDCKIGNFVTIGSGVNIAGNVTIADESWIGIGATIVEGVTIGKRAFIAAGAVVTKDISDDCLAMGVPAKPVRKLNESDWAGLI